MTRGRKQEGKGAAETLDAVQERFNRRNEVWLKSSRWLQVKESYSQELNPVVHRQPGHNLESQRQSELLSRRGRQTLLSNLRHSERPAVDYIENLRLGDWAAIPGLLLDFHF